VGGNGGTPVQPIDPSTIVGSGDLWSCTADLIAWVQALEDGRVLPRERVEVMRSTLVETEETHDEVADICYGYGWFTSTLDGHPFIWHSGDQPGYRALLIWIPQRRVTFATLTADELDLAPIVLPALHRLLAGGRTDDEPVSPASWPDR
jgi:CubicO group peptidase (beta-lactamase class C family)